MTGRAAVMVGCVLLPGVLGAGLHRGDERSSETYESASLAADGSLIITTAGGKMITIAREGEQSSFSPPVVSSNRAAVGAQAYFPNCCTSYDIPLELVIYRNGSVRRFRGIGLPIFEWHFADAGGRVAFGQEPVHSGCEIHYELRQIESGRLLDSADIPQACGQIPNPRPVKIPRWVSELASKK